MRIEEKLAELCGIDEDADGVRLETAKLQWRPVDEDDVIFTKTSENEVVVSYVTHDSHSDASDYWKENDGVGDFTIFRTEGSRDEHLESVRAEGKLALIVNKYEHGNVHYSVQGSMSYPDMRWDVAPSGVLVPCDHVQEKYQEALKAAQDIQDPAARKAAEDAALADAIKDSNVVLDEYSKLCNGEVYGVVHETWTVSPDGRTEMTDDDAVWGFVGYEYAKESMKEEAPKVEAEESPTP